jgi:antitoxin component of RelBE/YafQ-DinJ toxin-antitoxin module
MKDELVQIRITAETKERIEKLAADKNLKQVTVLEYLLRGKINLKELGYET